MFEFKDHIQKLTDFGIPTDDFIQGISYIQFFRILYLNTGQFPKKNDAIQYILNNMKDSLNIPRGLEIAKSLGPGKSFNNLSNDIKTMVETSLGIILTVINNIVIVS